MPILKYPILDGMKLCGVCRASKPVSEFRPARKHLSAACVPCIKAYKAEYRQRPEVKQRGLAYSRVYRSDPENRKRLNDNTRRHRRRTDTTRRNEVRRAWAATEKKKAVEYKGGACVCCGYSACLAALDFHHPDPSQKSGYGTGALKAHWTFERNKPELDKCVLVCVRCHREIHAGARSL